MRIRPGWLPEGYALEDDTSLLYLLREEDGSVVAVYSTFGASRGEILEAALLDGRRGQKHDRWGAPEDKPSG